LNSSALLLSKDALDEVVTTIAEAAIGGSSIDPAGLVGGLLRSYKASLKKEMLMYEIIAAMWLGVLVLGGGFMAWETLEEFRSSAIFGGCFGMSLCSLLMKTFPKIGGKPRRTEA
jgi:hypothetical protein